MYKVRLKALEEGAVLAQKALQGSLNEDEGVPDGNEREQSESGRFLIFFDPLGPRFLLETSKECPRIEFF